MNFFWVSYFTLCFLGNGASAFWTEKYPPRGWVYDVAVPFSFHDLNYAVSAPAMSPIPIWKSMPHILAAFNYIRDAKLLQLASDDKCKKLALQDGHTTSISWKNDGLCAGRAALVHIALSAGGFARLPPSDAKGYAAKPETGLPYLPANVFAFPKSFDSALAPPLYVLPRGKQTGYYWDFHVAPIVRYPRLDGTYVDLVLDPLLDPNLPMPLHAWLSIMDASQISICSTVSVNPSQYCLFYHEFSSLSTLNAIADSYYNHRVKQYEMISGGVYRFRQIRKMKTSSVVAALRPGENPEVVYGESVLRDMERAFQQMEVWRKRQRNHIDALAAWVQVKEHGDELPHVIAVRATKAFIPFLAHEIESYWVRKCKRRVRVRVQPSSNGYWKLVFSDQT